MERRVGTISRGIRCPIIREGDDLVKITVDSVLLAAESEGFQLRNRDVIALTESIVARAQGNYAHIKDIAADMAGIENYTLISYPEPMSPLDMLLNQGKESYIEARLGKMAGQFKDELNLIHNIEQMNSLQARLPFSIYIR